MIREWFHDLISPPDPGLNWTAGGALLEHLFEGRLQREPDRDGQSFDVVVTNDKGEQECISWM